MKKIEVKSLPEHFTKKKSGVKKNTADIVDITDAPFKILREPNCEKGNYAVIICGRNFLN